MIASDESLALCATCGSVAVEALFLPFPLVRHMDFAPFDPGTGGPFHCRNCHMINIGQSGGAVAEINAVHQSREYATIKKTEHLQFLEEFDGPVTPYVLEAEILAPFLQTDSPSILDIGCFDGKLLRELGYRFPAAELHGFDVSLHIETVFPKGDRFRFWCADLTAIGRRFDLISSVNSLVYVRDGHDFMANVRRLLEPDGMVFIMVCDAEANPLHLLCGDQYLHFTPKSLGNFLATFGFTAEILDQRTWFPRSIVAIVRPDPHAGGPPEYVEDDAVPRIMNHLADMKAALEQMSRQLADGSLCRPLAVLGTTHNAAATHSVLGDSIDLFVDENESRVGQAFYGKPVRHPRELEDDTTVILPYGTTAPAIQERFARLYKGTFVCL